MRLNEIFNERLETAGIGLEAGQALRQQLPRIINKWYVTHAKLMPFYAYKADQDIPSPDRAPGKDEIRKMLSTNIIHIFHQISEHLPTGPNFNHPPVVMFAKMPKPTTNGSFNPSNNLILINVKHIEALAADVYDELEDSFLGSGYEVHDRMFEGRRNFTTLLDTIAEIWTHELTHSQQDNKFPAAKANYRAYSSYLVKNKDKFYTMLNAAEQDPSKWDDKAYLSSPQEVDAFAHEFVFKTLNDMHLDDEGPETIKLYLDDLLQYFNSTVASTRYNNMKGSDNPMVQKARKRFLKKVYQELDHQRDVAIQRMKEQPPEQIY